MSADENARLKDRFVEAVLAGDHQALRALAHADFELWQDPSLPYGGVYRGAEGFIRFLERFMATFAIERLENTRSYHAADGSIVTEFGFSGRVAATGRRFDTTLLEQWDFADGQVRRILACWFERPF